jgi:RNA polymerase sigma-70 factor (ECF subfamily)
VIDDAQLIDQTLQGRTEAFGQLVLKYQDRLFNTVFHVVGHAEDARDVVQEALVQAFLKLDSFEHRSTFYSWLYRIAFNAAVAHRRRRTMAPLDRLAEANAASPTADGPAEKLERKERCRQVRQALAQLPVEYRTVLVLREIDGCDYETLAEILELPIGTVRSRLHRGRLQLKEILRTSLALKEEMGEQKVK